MVESAVAVEVAGRGVLAVTTPDRVLGDRAERPGAVFKREDRRKLQFLAPGEGSGGIDEYCFCFISRQ